jgi:hypothetical protein
VGTTEQAARAYRIAEVRYREGISTQIELSDSRLLFQQAQWNASTAARDLEMARLRLRLLRDLPVTAGGAAAGAQGAGGQGGAAGGAAGLRGSAAPAPTGSSATSEARRSTIIRVATGRLSTVGYPPSLRPVIGCLAPCGAGAWRSVVSGVWRDIGKVTRLFLGHLTYICLQGTRPL